MEKLAGSKTTRRREEGEVIAASGSGLNTSPFFAGPAGFWLGRYRAGGGLIRIARKGFSPLVVDILLRKTPTARASASDIPPPQTQHKVSEKSQALRFFVRESGGGGGGVCLGMEIKGRGLGGRGGGRVWEGAGELGVGR